MASIQLPIASPLTSERLALAPHRILPLKNGDVAILAERNTGWCVVHEDEYHRLVAFLGGAPLTISQVSDASKRTLLDLWNAGLLLAGKQYHPETKRPLDRYPSSLLLKLTGACNFDCTYCYDYDRERFKARLDLDRICTAVDFLLSKREHLSITFHGGEPLLRFDLIQNIVNYTLGHLDQVSRVRFSIQTNGALINDEVVSFLEKHNFSVGISIDGKGEISNRLRPTRGRSLSAWGHVQRLFDEYPEFVSGRCGFLAVASKTSATSLPDFALWLQEQGVRGLTITFLDLTGRGINLFDEKLTPTQAVSLYARFIDLIRAKKIEELALNSIISRINNLFTFRPQDFCHKGPCGAAGEFLVLDAEGTFRTCDCIYDPYFELGKDQAEMDNFLGNPARHAIQERHEWLRDEGADCSSCALFGLCGGTCVAKAIANNGTPQSIDPIDCAITRWIYPLLIEEFTCGGKTPILDYYRIHKPHMFESLDI
jgi:uncharacterized protein